MLQDYFKKILLSRVYEIAEETPLTAAKRLSEKLGHRILLKREDLQPVFSFKIRGAYNKIIHLSEQEKNQGIIAASAGNHAQGVAMSAQKLGLSATIVMPTTTPQIKIDAVKSFGAKAVLFGDSYDEAYGKARELALEQQLTFIHPYDDPYVIAGQGTIGMEVLRQAGEDIDAIFVPVGGGGLLAGIIAYVKVLRPDVKIIAVEPEDAACLKAAMESGSRTVLDKVGIFADGVAVKQIGKETFRIVRDQVDGVVCVSTDEICTAIKDIFEDTRAITEPAGALAVAGMKKYAQSHAAENQTWVAIQSGANMNFDRLRHVAERSALGDSSESLLAVTIPERSGSFENFCRTLGRLSITEFNYRYADDAEAHVFVGVKTLGNEAEKMKIIGKLEASNYRVDDLSDNETAKLHIRYMVGGHAPKIANERLYRFEFPERPGALLDFLTRLGKEWNISLFHYRNHGADFGRVLMGIQVDPDKHEQFERFVANFSYQFFEETDNIAYRLFANGNLEGSS